MSYDPPVVTPGTAILADGSVPMAADLDFDGFTGINAVDPVNPQDLATKNYADSITGGTGLTQAQTLVLVSLRA